MSPPMNSPVNSVAAPAPPRPVRARSARPSAVTGRFYRRVLAGLNAAGVPFLVGAATRSSATSASGAR